MFQSKSSKESSLNKTGDLPYLTVHSSSSVHHSEIVILNYQHCFSELACQNPAVTAQSGFMGCVALGPWEGPSVSQNCLCSPLQTQMLSQETRGQKVTGLGAEGGASTEPGQMNAIIQAMIEALLQDQPEESFSLNSGGLRMLRTQMADFSVDPLWSNKDRRVEGASSFDKPRSSTLSMSAKTLRKGMLLWLFY